MENSKLMKRNKAEKPRKLQENTVQYCHSWSGKGEQEKGGVELKLFAVELLAPPSLCLM